MDTNRLSGLHILVVDDSADSQLLMKVYLKKCGATVTGADNGRECCEKVASTRFDLILMDIQMPEMNGYETTALLRSRGITTPIIALTAHAMDSVIHHALKVGCNAHVAKPIDLRALAGKISELAQTTNSDAR